MAAPKGNKFAGNRKGVPNKRTIESVQRIEWVLGKLEETLEYDLTQISSLERVKLWDNLQEYIRPKLARTELTTNDNTVNFIVKIDE